MRRRPVRMLLCLFALSLPLSACGDDGSGEETAATRAPTPAAASKAEAICRDLLAGIKDIGSGALAEPPETTLALTTERLVRPSLPLLERTAARLQRLKPAADSRPFDLYTNLFDPFIVLTEKRLEAGLEGNAARAKGLEEQLTDLSLVQRRAAQLAGLRACDIDFPKVLLDSLTE